MKNLLKMMDLQCDEINEILTLASKLKLKRDNNINFKPLKDKTLGCIFQKESTRTRVSFEVGMHELGGTSLFLSSRDLQISRGEPIKDTARVLSRYLDAMMIRTYEQRQIEEFAKYSQIPVINGLTDFAHPCQVLADLMTIQKYKGSLKDLKICYIGDGNNMANSLTVGALKMGMLVSLACPKGFYPNEDILEFAKNYDNFELLESPEQAAIGADILATDTWISMGQESQETLRKETFKNYQINKNLLNKANKDAIVLHCLPAHRGEEITDEVLEEHKSEIFDEAENRLHVQKAVLMKLLAS